MIRILPLLLFFALAIMLLLGVQNQASNTTANESAETIQKPWPLITVKNAHGESVKLDATQLGGKVTVINMFASWCEPCKAEMPELVQLHKASQAQFHGIVWNNTPATMHNWLAKYGNPFDAVWYDNTGQAAIALGLRGVPETFVVDKRGVLRYHMAGAITPEFAAAKLLPLLAKLQEE